MSTLPFIDHRNGISGIRTHARRLLLPISCILVISVSVARAQPASSGTDKLPDSITEIEEALTKANELWQKGDATNGIPTYKRLLGPIEKTFGKDSSTEGLVLFRIGFLHALQGDFESALPHLERSQSLVASLPDDESSLVTKGNLYWGLGLSYQSLLKFEQAIQAFNQSLSYKEKLFGVEDPKLVEILTDVAHLHSTQERPVEAIPLLERALAITERRFGPESAEAVQVLALLGNTRRHAGQFEGAMTCLKRSLEISERVLAPTNAQVAICLINLGSLYSDHAEYQQAVPLIERGVKLLEKCYVQGDSVSAFGFAVALNHLGTVQIETGDYDKGIGTLRRSLAITESKFGSASINLVTALNSLAVAYHQQGDFERTLPLLERVQRILKDAPPHKNRELVIGLNNLAELFRDLGNEAEALRLFNRALEISESSFGPDNLDAAYCLNGLALIHQHRGDASNALALFQRSLAILENARGTSNQAVAGILNNISALYNEIGNTNLGLTTLQKALSIQEQVLPKEHPALATTLHNLGVMFVDAGDLTNALRLFRKSVAITDAAFGKDNPHSCLRLEGLALFEAGNGEWENGLDHFVEAARRRRRYFAAQMTFGRSTAGSWIEDARSAADRLHSRFGLAQGSWLLRPAATACAEHLALGKALLEEVETIGARLAATGRPRIQELLARSRNVKNRLDAIARRDEATWQRERMGWRKSEPDKLEQELSDVEEELASISGMVAQTVRERDLSLADIARTLPQESVLIDFVQYRRYDSSDKTNQWKEQHYAAYLTFPLSRDSTDAVVERVDLGEAALINEAVEIVCRRMSAGQYAAKDLRTALSRLADLLYTPLAKHLGDVSHLVICPDGQLSRLPFEMLPVGKRFLVEEKTITYVTSGREIPRLAGNHSSSKAQTAKCLVLGNPDFDLDPANIHSTAAKPNVQLVGDRTTIRSLSRDYRGLRFSPLPGSEAEARGIAKLLGSEAILRVGADAREAELKAVVSPRILHLATHGFFLTDQEFKRTNAMPDLLASAGGLAPGGGRPEQDWENPMKRCGIALAGANHATRITEADAEDGLLTGLEASLLNLQGMELVILSACESGTGEVRIGEGVMSLRRAFRIAGAETVLASHWKVSDKATSQLMTEFIRRWRAGTPRAEAWREAQLTLLRSKEFANPYFWAAFTLTGAMAVGASIRDACVRCHKER